MKKLANGLFLKQTISLYKSTQETIEKIPQSMQSFMKIPTLDTFFRQFLRSQKKSVHNYTVDDLTDRQALYEKWGTPLEKNKKSSVKSINFATFTPQEKKALIDAMLNTCLFPHIDTHASSLGLDAITYKKFVSDIFDLDSKELTIPTAAGSPIVLQFTKKDISGFINVENKKI